MPASTGLGDFPFSSSIFSKARKYNPTLYLTSNNNMSPSSTDAANSILRDFLFEEGPHVCSTNSEGMGFFGF